MDTILHTVLREKKALMAERGSVLYRVRHLPVVEYGQLLGAAVDRRPSALRGQGQGEDDLGADALHPQPLIGLPA